MQVVPIKDKIIVKIDRTQEDEIKLAGGINLYLSTRLNLEEHVTVKGICVGIPANMKREDTKNIHPIVNTGDEVYFSYQAIFDQELTEDIQYHKNELIIKGESYWIVDYICVFFVKRVDEIVMVGSHVLIDPIYEGRSVGTHLLLPSSMKSEKRKDKGIVISIGLPNKDESEIDVKSGDIVAFDERYVERYNFWGKPFYVIKQDRILHKLCS